MIKRYDCFCWFLNSVSHSKQKRREDLLTRQRAQRRAVLDSVRKLVADTTELDGAAAGADDSMDGVRSSPKKQVDTARYFYSKQLMVPEWLISVPDHLNGHWFVRPRPEGRHCIVVSSKGRTMSRLRTGEVLHSFQSLLPAGGHTPGQGTGHCILDCIFNDATNTYYVLDVMVWKGQLFYDCGADFRCVFVTLYSECCLLRVVIVLSAVPLLSSGSFVHPRLG